MGKAPAFQIYASDFYTDTDHWTIKEIGIYPRLLLSQWTNIELPNEPSRLARIAGCDVRTLNRNWQDTIAKKFILNECLSFKFFLNVTSKVFNFSFGGRFV